MPAPKNPKGACRVVIVAFVAIASVDTTWAQDKGLQRKLREKISRTLNDESLPSASTAFDIEIKITASDAEASDGFGVAVAISADTPKPKITAFVCSARRRPNDNQDWPKSISGQISSAAITRGPNWRMNIAAAKRISASAS